MKDFSEYISNKKRNRENVGLLLQTRDLVTQKIETEEVLKCLLCFSLY